jgi:hypothetical protein
MKLWRGTLALAAMLLGEFIASDTLAAHGGGRSGGNGGGHWGGHSGHFAGGGHFGGGFAAPIRFVPRRVFYAAPVAYFPPAYYYPPPPAYYYPPSYYDEPAQPPMYYEPPVQSSLPSGGSYPAPPPARYYPPSYNEPAQTPIYFCKDGSGRTNVTNRKEDTVGKDCNELPVQRSTPPGGSYRPPPSSGSAPASPRGPYAAQDALRFRFYCPDTRKYYPDVNTCDSAWLKVVPDGVAARR